MAIQNRRGAYADFDPSKLKPGEYGVVQSGDPTSTTGQAVYLCVSAGHVMRLASLDELKTYCEATKTLAVEAKELADDAAELYLGSAQSAQAAANSAAQAASLAGQANTTANAAKTESAAAQTASAQAVISANQAVDAAETAVEKVEENDLAIAVMQEGLNEKVDGAYKDDDGFLYLTSNGEVVVGPLGPFAGSGGGGGGGGSAENNAVLSMSNTTGWLFGTFAEGQSCPVSFTWSSLEGEIPTGAGSLRIVSGGSIATTMSVEQGTVSLDLKEYLKAGTNAVRLNLTDVYGNQRYINFTIKVVAVSITSNFDASVPFTGTIQYTYIPTGAVAKTIHFKVDGTDIGTQTVSSSGRQQTYLIAAQTHGSHTLEVYFTATIEGMEVESNHLFYDLICITDGNTAPVISVGFNRTTVSQYESIVIPYQVYNPSGLTASVALKEGDKVLNTLTVDRTKQTWAYRVNTAGSHTLTITSGDTVKTITFTATETVVDVAAETADQALYLSSYGRSNGEANPGVWSYNGINCTFANFGFISDGWQQDEDGITVLRVSGDARLTIPYQIFGSDFRTTGKTIEIELATRDVRDYDAVILSCLSGGRGLKMTGQLATLTSEQSEISMQYKEGEHIRLSFVVSKRNENRLIYVYINGVMSGCVQYPADDNFQQASPVGISVGSNNCTVDLYTIRIYDNNLNAEQLLGNWIADTQIGSLMMDRYVHNDVFDDYGNIVIDKLPKDLPYIIWEAEYLPQYKGNKVQVKGSYTDPIDASKSFTFLDAQLDVQGTSSQYYARKNYKQKYKNGFVTSQGTVAKYALRTGAIPADTFTYKADVASSEGANNVELVRLYNETCPVKTAAMTANSAVRWGIDGFPIVAFFKDTTSGTTTFLGKYNFNNDKGTPEVFGFTEGDESWEVLNNTSDRVVFKSADFTGTGWQSDFEARYPEDNTDCTKLKAMCEWVLSTKDNPTKFKSELADHFNVQSSLFYWLFTEMFLMVDSRAKNAFPTYIASDQKWYWLPYDLDTALGISNEGQLVFGYSLEDTDQLEGNVDVFNGQSSVFWNNLRSAYGTELKAMYQQLRSTGSWSYAKVSQMFESHQAKWPVALVNEDSKFKYLDPLTQEGNGSYLTMLQGLKTSQRAWWLYNRFRYMDAKYNAGDDLTDVITVRGYAKDNIKLTPYADIYCNIKYGSYLVSQRGYRNQTYTLNCPLDNVNDTEIYIYSASQMASVGDLSGLKVGYADFANATKLQSLKLGSDTSGYTNPNLTDLHLGNNRLLQTVDLRNCTSFAQTLDLTGCANIESIYMEGTKVTGINLPNGGIISTLHLPATVTNLTIRNQTKLLPAGFSLPSTAQLTTLWVENTPLGAEDLLDLAATGCRVRLIDIQMEAADYDAIDAFYDLLDNYSGIDEQGNNTEKAQVSGTIHVPNILGSQVVELKARYPYLEIDADHISCTVKYYSEDGQTLLHTETVTDGANATYTGTATKTSTAQYNYTFNGWSATPGGPLWANAKVHVTEDRNLYAHFSADLRYYTVYFYNGSTLLQTVQHVPYGGTAQYTAGSTSSITNSSGDPFTGWNPLPSNIQGNTSCYAQFVPMYTCTFKNGDTTLYTVRVRQGQAVTYAGPDMSTVEDANGNPWCGWDKALTNIQANTTFNAIFYNFEETITDTWDQIFEHEASGDYATRYSVGDKKVIDLGTEGKLAMQIVGFDKDAKADGSGKAPITWIARELLKTSKRWNPSYSQTTHNEQVPIALKWVFDTENGGYKSDIGGVNNGTSPATIKLTPTESGTLTISYKVSSESRYDKLTVKVNGTTVANEISGELDWATYEVEATAGAVINIEVNYTKNSSGDTGTDAGYVKWSGVAVTSELVQSYRTVTYIDTATGGTIGGWEDSELRAYYRDTLYQLIPENIRSHIVPVTKTQTAYRINTAGTSTESYTQTSTETVWPPSYPEMFSSGNSNYTSFFTNNASRSKKKVGASSAASWWLRSAGNGNYASTVTSDGSYNYGSTYNERGLTLGFCT